MKLTGKEIEIMSVLWDNKVPMAAADIIEASPNRTWKETSIHVMLKSLQAKNAVGLDHYIPTAGRAAGAFRALVSREEYALLYVLGLGVDLPLLVAAAEEIKETDGKGKSKRSPKR